MSLRRSKPAPRRDGYREWADYLEQWAQGREPDGVEPGPLDPEDFAPDTWKRLTNRFTAAISQRMDAWQKALSRAASVASDEFAFGRALQQARPGARTIRALAADQRLPDGLRTQLTGLVDKSLRQMQERMEEDVALQRGRGDADRFVEARLRTLHDNPLTAVTTRALAQEASGGGSAAVQPASAGWAAPAPDGTPRRRVIRP